MPYEGENFSVSRTSARATNAPLMSLSEVARQGSSAATRTLIGITFGRVGKHRHRLAYHPTRFAPIPRAVRKYRDEFAWRGVFATCLAFERQREPSAGCAADTNGAPRHRRISDKIVSKKRPTSADQSRSTCPSTRAMRTFPSLDSSARSSSPARSSERRPIPWVSVSAVLRCGGRDNRDARYTPSNTFPNRVAASSAAAARIWWRLRTWSVATVTAAWLPRSL